MENAAIVFMQTVYVLLSVVVILAPIWVSVTMYTLWRKKK